MSANATSRNKPAVYFIFPYRGVGGVPVLFVRVGEYLASRGTINAHFVDYADGAMAKMMKPRLGHLLEYVDGGNAQIPDGAYAVFQSMTPWSIYSGLVVSDSVKLLFWNCHAFNLIPTLPGIRSYMQSHLAGAKWLLNSVMLGWRNRMRAFLHTLLINRAIVFMDVNNVDTTQAYLDCSIPQANYLPIPVSTMDLRGRPQKPRDFVNDPVVRIVWIGRVVDFKFYILKRTLYALEAAQEYLNHSIEFTVVGDGEFLGALQVVANELRRIKVRFIERIAIEELDDFLCANADLVMAMGTSVLEGARLGIPAILLDQSFTEVPERYHFRWLYERKGYTLADIITSQHLATYDQSLLHRLNELLADYQAQSDRCRQYVVCNHGLEVLTERFMGYLLCSDLSWGDLRRAKHLRRGWIYSTFAMLRKSAKQRGFFGKFLWLQ